MWWVPLIAAGILGAIVLGLYLVQRQRQVSGARAYRSRFVQVVAQLDDVTDHVNKLAVQLKRVKEPKILDYYEGTLRILETLLSAMRKIPPFGTDTHILASAVFLVRDCRQRVGRLQKAIHDSLRGLPLRLEELYGGASASVPRSALKVTGCYFCSRPVLAERFAEVKVRIEGEIRDVTSCQVCKDELAATRKVKILHFLQDGKPVHWSQVADYLPSEDYWNINKRQAQPKSRHLELVHPSSEAHEPD